MARARAGKAFCDTARFEVYDEAVAAVLRVEGITCVRLGDVQRVAWLVREWMDIRGCGYSPNPRTIRRHLYRKGLISEHDNR
jgi:hypothetical protein